MRRGDQRKQAVFALYQHDLTGRAFDELIESDASAFTRELVSGTAAAQDQLDEMISANSKDWSLDRIAPLERNILRVALFELTTRFDVPVEVAIDQAVELTKRYCSADAPAFVNGILGSALRSLPARPADSADEARK